MVSRLARRPAPVPASLLAALLAVLVAACGSASDAGGGATSAAGAGVRGEPARLFLDDQYPRFVDAESGLTTILGSPDLAVGRHRVAFVLSDAQGLIRLPVTRVASYYVGDGPGDVAAGAATGPFEQTTARFHEFPFGVRGVFVTELTFDRAGTWAIEAFVPLTDGSVTSTRFAFPVAERTAAPAVGDAAPRSDSRTAADVESLRDLTTGAQPDAALYEQSIAQALDEGRPLVVVFASPGFCTNALCGPQAEVLSEVRERYPDGANYVHVDLYLNPQEIRTGGLDVARRTPVLEQWGLRTDEWTFVIDAEGLVAARFEGFATFDELEAALLAVLD